MGGSQKIHCTVESCKHHLSDENLCKLQSILVEPAKNCNTEKCDESLCSSYDYEEV